jgi:DNA helicase HerA-like ATPase
VEQVVKLISSKGVGIYFVTQNPLDIPDDVLGQLGNRIQHALRAFTPRDQRAVKAAADTFRTNPKLDTKEVITNLGVGEALVSVLEEGGAPSIVQRTLVRPPASRIGPASDAERSELLRKSPLAGRYDNSVDRESAHEILKKRADEAAVEAEEAEKEMAEEKKRQRSSRGKGRSRQSVGEAMAKSVARAIGSQIGRKVVRGILGSIFRGR